MTLQEALKSKKQYRHPGMTVWYDVPGTPLSKSLWNADEITREDWELKADEPKWIRGWTQGKFKTALPYDYGDNIYQDRVTPDIILLIDARPVKALIEAIKGYNQFVFPEITEVEKLLKESE